MNPYSLFTYDATTLYLLLLNETLSEGLDYRDGSLLFQKARNKTFTGNHIVVVYQNFNLNLITKILRLIPKSSSEEFYLVAFFHSSLKTYTYFYNSCFGLLFTTLFPFCCLVVCICLHTHCCLSFHHSRNCNARVKPVIEINSADLWVTKILMSNLYPVDTHEI